MIDWEDIEERLAYLDDKPDCIPEDIREWTKFREQYENAVDFIQNYKSRDFSHPDMTKQFLEQKLHEIGYLGYGYKKSIFEVLQDGKTNLIPELDWSIVKNFRLFFVWNINLSNEKLTVLPNEKLTVLPLLPKHVGGYFWCDKNKLTTLDGAPQHVGGNFNCHYNQLTSLKGAPQHVGGNFNCDNNQLTSLEGAPQHVGENFYCYDNQLTSLEGAPQHVGGNFWCGSNLLPKSIPDKFPGEGLPKYMKMKESIILSFKNFKLNEGVRKTKSGYKLDFSGDKKNDIMSLSFLGKKRKSLMKDDVKYSYYFAYEYKNSNDRDLLQYLKKMEAEPNQMNMFIKKAILGLDAEDSLSSFDAIVYPKSSSKLLKAVANYAGEKAGSNTALIPSIFLKNDKSKIELDEESLNKVEPKTQKQIRYAFNKCMSEDGEFKMKKIFAPYRKFIKGFLGFDASTEAPNKILGGKVLLIDDYKTTGTTLKEMLAQLINLQPKEIVIMVIINVK